MTDDYLDGFLDGMQAAVGALRRISRPSDPDVQPPTMIADHPTPIVVYHPDRVGFYQIPCETD